MTKIFFCNNSAFLQYLPTKHQGGKEIANWEEDRTCTPDISHSIKMHSNNSINPLMPSNQRALFPLVTANAQGNFINPTSESRTTCVYAHSCSHSHFPAFSHTQTYMCRHYRVVELEHISHTICETTQTLLTSKLACLTAVYEMQLLAQEQNYSLTLKLQLRGKS